MATSYQQRIATYLASHPGATVQEARGHGRTPEHGLSGMPAPTGHVYETTRTGDVKNTLRYIEKQYGSGARVEITTYDKNGNPHHLLRETRAGKERGASVEIHKTLAQHKSFRLGIYAVMRRTPSKGSGKDPRFRNITRVTIRVIQ